MTSRADGQHWAIHVAVSINVAILYCYTVLIAVLGIIGINNSERDAVKMYGTVNKPCM
jgi:hypothetical protein